jgi:hypothetical protein
MPGYPCHAPFGPVQIRSRQICHAWLSLPRPLRASANPLPADLSCLAIPATPPSGQCKSAPGRFTPAQNPPLQQIMPP